jgi:hypothetical protein
MYVNGAVPPDVVAVKTILLPEHIVGADCDKVTFNEHDWVYPRNDKSKNKQISKRFFINPDKSFLSLYLITISFNKYQLFWLNVNDGKTLQGNK